MSGRPTLANVAFVVDEWKRCIGLSASATSKIPVSGESPISGALTRSHSGLAEPFIEAHTPFNRPNSPFKGF